jgi:uncharacterized protein involved in exopolysaccharide biosynthesis
MSQRSEVSDNEISIRDLIEVVWKGKFFIAIVTVIAVIVSAVVSFFILPETYSTTMSLAVKPVTVKMSTIDNAVGIVDYLGSMPIKTKEEYMLEVKSSRVLNRTIEMLASKDGAGDVMSVGALSQSITVADVLKTDRITVTVTCSDPEEAVLIADTLAEAFGQIAAEDFNEQILDVSDAISEELAESEAYLDEKVMELNAYRSENVNIDVLRADIIRMIDQIALSKIRLIDYDTQIESDQIALRSILADPSSMGDLTFGEYELSINDGNNDGNMVPNIIISPNGLQESLFIAHVMETQARLLSSLSKKEVYETQIPKMESDLLDMQIALTDHEYTYDNINNDAQMAQKAYRANQQRALDAQNYASSEIGNSIVSISAAASVPGAPISPNIKMNIIAAGIFGFGLSVCIILFRDYWKRTAVVHTK